MTTDTTEHGLEQRVCALLTHRADAPAAADVRERPATYEPGWLNGHSADYDREHCIDLAQLTAFLKTTQPHLADALVLDADSPTRRKFLARLKNEVGKRGIVEVLRNGVKHGPHTIALLYGTPSPGNPQAAALYEQNRFSVTRQLSYSNANKRLTLDLALFINGLPVATFELKNSLTKQTAADAVEQYKRDRDPKEELFRLGRCMVHFAVDDLEVLFCTHLNGKASWFLPFNKGWNDVALPLNMFYNTGIATYIWVLTNRKPAHRQGKVQLIDATEWFSPLRKNLGNKNCALSEDDIGRVCAAFLTFEESEHSKIFPNRAFGYWRVTVERPLRLGRDAGERPAVYSRIRARQRVAR